MCLTSAAFAESPDDDPKAAAPASGAAQHARRASAVEPDGVDAGSGQAPTRSATIGAAALGAMIDQIARQQGVEPVLVHAVISAESAYDPTAVSHAGAIGLMQLMPATAADYGVSDLSSLFDPETNLLAGTRHLKRLLAKYDNDYGRAIMAYNAGEGVVDRTNSQVTFPETLDYTEAVLRRYGRLGGQRPTSSALQQVAALRAKTDRRAAQESLERYLDAAILPKTGRALEGRLLGPTARESLAPQDVVMTREPWRRTGRGADPAIDPAIRDRGRLPRYDMR